MLSQEFETIKIVTSPEEPDRFVRDLGGNISLWEKEAKATRSTESLLLKNGINCKVIEVRLTEIGD